MSALSRLWTGSVAYVSLLAAAGVSMAGNLADTYRTRGGDADNLDKVLAVIWPLFVILAIEMFVSPRWKRTTMFQVWRWTGSLAIGGLAMMASWTHLHDLLASRGQLAIVAMGGPLAIDGMAIMATGLILSTRVQDMATGQLATAPVVQDTAPAMASDPGLSFGGLATQPDDPTLDIKTALDRWDSGYHEAIEELGQELATEAEAYAHGQATVKTPPVIEKVPDEARDLILRMLELGAAPGEIKKAVAEMNEVSTRTAQRWLSAVRRGGNSQGEEKGN